MRSQNTGSRDSDDVRPWWRDAACVGEPLVLFFGTSEETEPAQRTREAKAKELCWGCPVRDACLLQAVLNGDTGIRGGFTVSERWRVRRRWMRRGQLIRTRTGITAGDLRGAHIMCDHCLRTGAMGGEGPRGMRLTARCLQRWKRAGRPDQVPDDDQAVKAA